MSARDLGARERVELIASVLAGETSAERLAEEFGVMTCFIQRMRAELRREGFRVYVPAPPPSASRNAIAKCNAIRAARRANP